MKIKILIGFLLVAAALGLYLMLGGGSGAPEQAQRVPLSGDEARAAAAAALEILEAGRKLPPREFAAVHCANPKDGELGMFIRTLQTLKLASTEPEAVERFKTEPDRVNVFFPVTEADGARQCQVLLRQGEAGKWRFEKLYLLN